MPDYMGICKNSSMEKSIMKMGRRNKNLRNFIDLYVFHWDSYFVSAETFQWIFKLPSNYALDILTLCHSFVRWMSSWGFTAEVLNVIFVSFGVDHHVGHRKEVSLHRILKFGHVIGISRWLVLVGDCFWNVIPKLKGNFSVEIRIMPCGMVRCLSGKKQLFFKWF